MAARKPIKVVPVAEISLSAVETTLAQRGSRYGDFTDHARLAQILQDALREHEILGEDGELVRPWDNLTYVMKQALTVICDKQARILNGDPNYKDNWHDIQGYAKLAEDRCELQSVTNKLI